MSISPYAGWPIIKLLSAIAQVRRLASGAARLVEQPKELMAILYVLIAESGNISSLTQDLNFLKRIICKKNHVVIL